MSRVRCEAAIVDGVWSAQVVEHGFGGEAEEFGDEDRVDGGGELGESGAAESLWAARRGEEGVGVGL